MKCYLLLTKVSMSDTSADMLITEMKYMEMQERVWCFLYSELRCLNQRIKIPTLVNKNDVRGMTPYWANNAIPTPLGFIM